MQSERTLERWRRAGASCCRDAKCTAEICGVELNEFRGEGSATYRVTAGARAPAIAWAPATAWATATSRTTATARATSRATAPTTFAPLCSPISMPSQLPSVSPMIGLLRSSTLAYLLSSIPQHTHESTHAPLLFIITTLIMIDNTLANQHAQQTKYLQTHRTHLAPTFSHASWRAFSFPTFSNLVSSHPEIAVRMIQHAFYDTPLNEISRRNAAVALRVLFTGYELYESLETFENDVKELCEMIKPLGTYSERDTALNFIRPNNEITCHGPLTPLYYPLIVSAPRYAVRLLSNVFLAHVQQYIRRTCPDTNLTFWSRVTDVNQPTVVFFHGIGLGVIPYLGMITGFLRYVRERSERNHKMGDARTKRAYLINERNVRAKRAYLIGELNRYSFAQLVLALVHIRLKRLGLSLACLICSILPCSPPVDVRTHIYWSSLSSPPTNACSRSLRSQVRGREECHFGRIPRHIWAATSG